MDDFAALLRRLERDLHDGAQIRLATLAMNLGMTLDQLGSEGDQPDLAAVRDLVGTAHRGAKDALAELRDLARGIHPPALDNGLAGQVGSHCQPQLISERHQVIGRDRPEFDEGHHAQTLRQVRLQMAGACIARAANYAHP